MLDSVLLAVGVLQHIPARGRKPCPCVSPQFVASGDYNISPQGDGNSDSLRITSAMWSLQLIPARGRKQISSIHLVEVVGITMYPRKGTETLSYNTYSTRFARITTYPRKGTQKNTSTAGRFRCGGVSVCRKSPFTGRNVGRTFSRYIVLLAGLHGTVTAPAGAFRSATAAARRLLARR